MLDLATARPLVVLSQNITGDPVGPEPPKQTPGAQITTSTFLHFSATKLIDINLPHCNAFFSHEINVSASCSATDPRGAYPLRHYSRTTTTQKHLHCSSLSVCLSVCLSVWSGLVWSGLVCLSFFPPMDGRSPMVPPPCTGSQYKAGWRAFSLLKRPSSARCRSQAFSQPPEDLPAPWLLARGHRRERHARAG